VGETQHSSSVVDIFATIRSAVDVLASLEWASDEDAAEFASDMSAVSKRQRELLLPRILLIYRR
jgi:hypothetical protein